MTNKINLCLIKDIISLIQVQIKAQKPIKLMKSKINLIKSQSSQKVPQSTNDEEEFPGQVNIGPNHDEDSCK